MTGRRSLHLVLALVAASPAAAQHAPALVGEDAIREAERDSTERRRTVGDRAGTPLLRIGDPAPPLRLSEFLVGSSDAGRFDEGEVTVVEFWATWCAPCVAGIPALNKLDRRFSDRSVTLIGVTREETPVVRRFLDAAAPGSAPSYAIATDDAGESTAAFMTAARRRGIPCVFVVDRSGRIAWTGHPKDLAGPLERIAEGSWNLDDARRDQVRSDRVRQVVSAIRDQIAAAGSIEEHRGVIESIDGAIARGDGDPELEFEKFRILIGPLADPRGYEVGWSLLKHHPDDADMLDRLANASLDRNSDLEPNPAFALEAAKAANHAAAGSDARSLATLARAYRLNGDRRRADRFAQRAIARASDVDRDRVLEILEQD